MSRRVFIRNLALEAHIGIHGHEQDRSQPVRINVELTVQDDQQLSDRLESVVDYAAVAQNIRVIVSDGHVNLAETLAERIARVCFNDNRVERARVRVEKLRAVADAESAGVEIERARAFYGLKE